LWRGLANGVLPGMLPDGVELKTIMDTWALQAGVPLVTVTRNYDTNKATITQVQYTNNDVLSFIKKMYSLLIIQKRFFNLPNDNAHPEKYWIPLTKTEQDVAETNDVTWLYDQDLTLNDMPGNDKWVLFNNRKNGNLFPHLLFQKNLHLRLKKNIRANLKKLYFGCQVTTALIMTLKTGGCSRLVSTRQNWWKRWT
jgi:hypothetical protein